RWMEHEKKYFSFYRLTGIRFLDDVVPTTDEPDRHSELQKQELDLFKHSGRLLRKVEYGYSKGDEFDPLIQLLGIAQQGQSFDLRSIPEKDTIYKLYALFLMQIHLLKVTRHFEKLRGHLVALIRSLRAHRFELERVVSPDTESITAEG